MCSCSMQTTGSGRQKVESISYLVRVNRKCAAMRDVWSWYSLRRELRRDEANRRLEIVAMSWPSVMAGRVLNGRCQDRTRNETEFLPCHGEK